MFPLSIYVWIFDDAAVPMVEAAVAMVLIDQLLAQYAQCQLFPINSEFQEPLQQLKHEVA